jgi:AcrR family transcriptional regulator
LLNAAQHLLSTRGADAVNVDEIADSADVSKGTFYNYFVDKESLIREVEEAVRAEIEQLIARGNAGVTDPAKRVAGAFASLLSWSQSDPIKARMLVRSTPHLTDPGAPMNVGVRADLHAGAAAGQFTNITDEAGIVLVLGVMSAGVNRALDIADQTRVRDLGENLAEALLVALGVARKQAATVARHAMARI